ncbi:hypothetical protein [Spirochaeta cellobiosiphila]|uniref:hypothetical protein n=1 Tax=Spirochaeta cellobiosiphila TaxID=504483 RepID=UPI00040D85FD|nr:hypothetical protein [Spirochaeta cellobiosiphila]
MATKYTQREIWAIREIAQKHGSICYVNDYNLEKEYFDLTNIDRKSGAIYMAYWRMQQGKYDHYLR